MRALGWAVLCSRMRVALTAQSKTRLAAIRIRQLSSRALKETALWQDATPISQNRDWIEWMLRETAADLKSCFKSQTARSAAARLGRDRQPGKPMHVLLCCHSKTAIVFILVRSAILLAIVLHSSSHSLLPTIIIDCIVHQSRLGS